MKLIYGIMSLTKILHTLTLSTLKLPDSGKMETVAQTSKDEKVRDTQHENYQQTDSGSCGSDGAGCRLTTGLCNEVGKEVLIAVLFTGDCSADQGCCLIDVMQVFG